MKRLPRKLKKKIKKIPVGDYCYGSAIGAKGKVVKGIRKYKSVLCPFYHSTKNSEIAFCSFCHKHDDFLLPDQTKICGELENHFDIQTGKFTKRNFIKIDNLPQEEQQPFKDWLVGQPIWYKKDKNGSQIALREYYKHWLAKFSK